MHIISYIIKRVIIGIIILAIGTGLVFGGKVIYKAGYEAGAFNDGGLIQDNW